MVDIGKIFFDCENAIGMAMKMLYENRPNHLILFLSQGEYNKQRKNTCHCPKMLFWHYSEQKKKSS